MSDRHSQPTKSQKKFSDYLPLLPWNWGSVHVIELAHGELELTAAPWFRFRSGEDPCDLEMPKETAIL